MQRKQHMQIKSQIVKQTKDSQCKNSSVQKKNLKILLKILNNALLKTTNQQSSTKMHKIQQIQIYKTPQKTNSKQQTKKTINKIMQKTNLKIMNKTIILYIKIKNKQI